MRTRCTLHPRRVVTVLLAGLSFWSPAGSLGDDADDIAAAIVRQTPNPADAAKKILDAAGAMTTSPLVQIRLTQKAYEQGMAAPGGYPTAISALNLLERIAPSRMASWREKRLEVYRLQYYRSTRANKDANGRIYLELLLARAQAAGKGSNWKDAAKYTRQAYQIAGTLKLPEKKDIYEDMRAAGSCEMMQNRVEVLRAALARNPNDAFSRKQLVMAHMVDLDRPEEAVKYLSDEVDPALHKNVTLAAKKTSQLADADFLALGLWYRSLAVKAALKHTKVRMLTRALGNIDTYLQVYTKQDARRLRATALVSSIEAQLKQLGVEVARRADLPTGAVLFLTFERKAMFSRDGRTYIRDLSGAKHNGLMVGGTFAARAGGSAMVFDGKSYVDVGNPPGLQITGDMTICMWINPANFSARQNPINKAYGGEGTWTLEGNGTINYWFGSGGGDRSPYKGYLMPALKVRQWTHVAVVRNMTARTVKWYANGKVVYSGRVAHSVKASPNHLLIGKGYVRNFQGMLDEVGVFKRALSAEEVRRLCAPPKGGAAP